MKRALWLAPWLLLLAACGGSSVTTGTVTGRVSDTTGNALVGATVIIAGQSTTTDDLGDYTVTQVAPGTHSVAVALTLYSFNATNVSIVAGRTTSLNFTGTRTYTAPTMTFSATPTSLSFDGGQVVLSITVSDSDGDTPTLTLQTESNGTLTELSYTTTGSGTYTSTVTLPANSTYAAMPYVYVAVATDGTSSTTQSVTVTVAGLSSPTNVSNGTSVSSGGPPVPEIRRQPAHTARP
jgi:hypothetical protein